jgi:hypothetical protein
MLKKHNALRLYLRSIWHFFEWLFSAPFRDLPPAFGDTVAPELRVFKAKVDEIQHHAVGKVSTSKSRGFRQGNPRK